MSETKVKCKDCPTIFTVTEGEVKFMQTHFNEKGEPLSLPKRCQLCRILKRKAYEAKAKKAEDAAELARIMSGEKITLQ